MSAGVLTTILLSAAATTYVLWPLFRSDEASAERTASTEHLQDLVSRHEMALQAIRDLDEDHALGKITAEDHAALREKLVRRALALMRELDAARERRPARPGPRRLGA